MAKNNPNEKLSTNMNLWEIAKPQTPKTNKVFAWCYVHFICIYANCYEINPQSWFSTNKKNNSILDQSNTNTDALLHQYHFFLKFTKFTWNVHVVFQQMNNLDTDMKTLFEQVGINNATDIDKDTVDFIYDFVEQHGGIQKIKEEMKQKPAPATPHHSKLLIYLYLDVEEGNPLPIPQHSKLFIYLYLHVEEGKIPIPQHSKFFIYLSTTL